MTKRLACLGMVIGVSLCEVATRDLAAQTVEPVPVPSARIPPPGPYAPGFDALRYRVAIVLPAQGERITANAAIDVLVTEPRRDTLRLDLSGLAVTRVQAAVNGAAAGVVPFRQDDGRLYVPVPVLAQSGDTLHLEVAYEGTPDDGLIIRNNVHGDRSVFADDYPDRARFWFPSIDHPGDKAIVSWEVTAPAGWQVIANGRRVGARDDAVPPDGVWRWETRVPIPTYTMVIGATRFTVGAVAECARGGATELRPDGCVRVTWWAFPPDRANAGEIFRRGGAMIEYYARRFGPYPYEKLAHVQSATRYGGMENVDAIFYSEQAIARGSLGETTVAHETIHQWFGDAVTPANWHHVWLSEGFATYFGMQFFEEADGVARFRELLAGSAASYLRSNVTDLPIVDTTQIPGEDLNAVLSANSYQKGGQVLHMLRGLLGDDAFFRGLRDYFSLHVHGNARTVDLQRTLEQVSGRDLAWFFEQWVYRPGYPILDVSQTWNTAAAEVVVTIDQVQKPEWPVFRMPVDLALSTPQGELRRRGELTGRRTILRFTLPAEPSRIVVDPDGWLLKQVR
ncbi:MAG: M1 family peptidase [Gemmatimonadetes bacterium]|nr:M1 family peptidase [Gemmatimonadota bacterium]